MRFAEEHRQFRPTPLPFVAEATTLATVSPRALVRLEGAVYSVPSRWAGLDLVVRIGATTVIIVGRDGTPIAHARKRFGQRSIDYRHFLFELARKPQAVRQVLPDLLRDLGPPFPAIWAQLHGAHGPREAARLFAKVLGQLDTHGAAVVVPPLHAALATGTPLLLALTPARSPDRVLDAVPAPLRSIIAHVITRADSASPPRYCRCARRVRPAPRTPPAAPS
jgi:Mu transposase, C-terminal domain